MSQKVNIISSGRTDKGVHALGQVSNFFIENQIPIEAIKNQINNYLNDEILEDKKLYWDNIPLKLINEGKIKVEVNLLPRNKAVEIDNILDYEKIQEIIKR